jgi:hypothetical protein
MNLVKFTLLTKLLLFTSVAFAAEVRLNFEYEVTVSIPSSSGTESSKKYSAGEDVVLSSDRVYWIESKGKVPVLVVPNSYSKKEPMKLALVETASWPSSTMQKVIDTKMSSMMDLMTQFQKHLTRKNVQGAEEVLARMTAIEDMPVLEVFRAYLAYMKGDIEKAKTTVKRALALHPENTQGQELLKTIEGKN